jgi:hypothetical protein
LHVARSACVASDAVAEAAAPRACA